MLAILKSFLFGLSLALAFVLGNFLLWKRAKEKDINSYEVFDLSLLGLAGGLILGRLVYILANWPTFQIDIFRWIHIVRYPGFSGKAVMIGFLLTVLYYCRKKKIKTWVFLDCLGVPFLYALLLGQTGCIFNSCVVGTATKLPWGEVYPGFLGHRHPAEIYAVILTLIMMFLVKKAEPNLSRWLSYLKKEKNLTIKPEGLVFLSVLVLFSLFDFLLEFTRSNALYFNKVNLALVFDAGLFLTGLGLTFFRIIKNYQTGEKND
ncbi:MAG: prolipoprotein diacylglyceryl transferase [Patescibacteria group bacterium]|nr:prolipoprotein diacylglyceryl transferase [Patescibacteria group bacterium]